jgi:hypothetical protein
MSAPKIPPRNPVSDTIDGVVLQTSTSQHILAAAPLPDLDIRHQGTMIVRYGVQYLQKPHSIVPGLIASDYGEMMTGENAWDWLFNKSNLYPRADVIGYRDDGQDDMVPVKMLDLMRPVDVLIYDDDQSQTPLAKAVTLITESPSDWPARLRQYLDVYASLDAWQEDQHHEP